MRNDKKLNNKANRSTYPHICMALKNVYILHIITGSRELFNVEFYIVILENKSNFFVY
jgi:hypothetical protein